MLQNDMYIFLYTRFDVYLRNARETRARLVGENAGSI